MKQLPLYLRLLGFYKMYKLQVPKLPLRDSGSGFMYRVNVWNSTLYWLGFKIKTKSVEYGSKV